jgi:cellulose synthase/poly-beta-1,6-N-acetylglucosamine synthase-like glycosyltransferase
MVSFYLLSILLIISYICLICVFIKGWNRLQVISNGSGKFTKVAVIIPVRNEEDQIPSLLESLRNQDYPPEKREIIFVNDHSGDQTMSILITVSAGLENLRILDLPEEMTGKKAAQQYAAVRTPAELLLFTDADCRPAGTWISSMVRCYENNQSVLISAPVMMESHGAFFSKFQALEFLSLTTSGAGSFGIGCPVMANGANLAVRRDLFLENFDQRKNKLASGDDIFLLLVLKKKYPGRLFFNKSPDSIVRTSGTHDLRTFIHQRLRWTSKARYYKDPFIIVTALVILLVNLWLSAGLIYLFLDHRFIIPWFIFLFLKSSVDFILLKKGAHFTGQTSLLKYFGLSQLVYFLYISFTGITGHFISFRWKDRKFPG